MHHVLEEEAMGFGRTGGAEASIGTNEYMLGAWSYLISTYTVHCALCVRPTMPADVTD